MIDEAAHEVGDQIDPERPARPEISENPDQIGHAGKHHATIGDRVREGDRLAVDGEVNAPEDTDVEASRGHDDVGLELLARLEQNALLCEAVDLVCNDGRLAGGDRPEQVAVRDEGDPLPPRPIAWREVLLYIVVGTEIGAHAGE